MTTETGTQVGEEKATGSKLSELFVETLVQSARSR